MPQAFQSRCEKHPPDSAIERDAPLLKMCVLSLPAFSYPIVRAVPVILAANFYPVGFGNILSPGCTLGRTFFQGEQS